MTKWLVDKSALVRLGQSPEVDVWLERIQRGLIHITSLTLFELGFSARAAGDLRTSRAQPPLALMPVEYLTPVIEDRAMDVQEQLAERGHHRAASIPDLLLAATAEMAGLDVLHVDKDFDLIADITNQATTRLTI